jgi:predicted HicB family RNase H-like nuclease
MPDSQKHATVSGLDRINLRLAPETFRAIDKACAARPGRVSRNTWLTEAVEEKLERESAADQVEEGQGRARHG